MTNTLEAETTDLAQEIDLDLTRVECCNTCKHGERKYFGDSDVPTGIRCLEEQPNEGRFDYKCDDLYTPIAEFIDAQTKVL